VASDTTPNTNAYGVTPTGGPSTKADTTLSMFGGSPAPNTATPAANAPVATPTLGGNSKNVTDATTPVAVPNTPMYQALGASPTFGISTATPPVTNGPTKATTLQGVSPDEFATAMQAFRKENPVKTGIFAQPKDILAIVNANRKDDYKDTTKLNIETQAAADKHAESVIKQHRGGVDENGNIAKADDQTLQLYGVPPAPSNAQQFGPRGDTIKAKLQDDASKAKDAYEKIAADNVAFTKEIDSGAAMGGANNLLASINQHIDARFQIMKSINKDLTLESFKSGSGLRTQQEFKTIQDANASPLMKEEAARAILAKTDAFALMTAERKEFISNYAQAHNTLDGSGIQYDKYIKANPILDQSPGASAFQPNANRKSYGEFFHPSAPNDSATPSFNSVVSTPVTAGQGASSNMTPIPANSPLNKFKAFQPGAQ
jgi:hypothetical protein